MIEQRLLHELMDNTTDLVFYQDRAHRFIRANRQCARLLGCREAEALTGRTVGQLLPKEAVPALYDADENERVLQSGQPSPEHSIQRAINDGAISKFLLKPWDDEELRTAIRDAFARFASMRTAEDRSAMPPYA